MTGKTFSNNLIGSLNIHIIYQLYVTMIQLKINFFSDAFNGLEHVGKLKLAYLDLSELKP